MIPNNNQNSAAMNEFLSYKGEIFQKLTLIPKEASVRNYYRAHYENSELILCIDEKFTSTPYTFMEVQNILKQNKYLSKKKEKQ